MKLFKGKLATDKPIEIFIALFVILATYWQQCFSTTQEVET